VILLEAMGASVKVNFIKFANMSGTFVFSPYFGFSTVDNLISEPLTTSEMFEPGFVTLSSNFTLLSVVDSIFLGDSVKGSFLKFAKIFCVLEVLFLTIEGLKFRIDCETFLRTLTDERDCCLFLNTPLSDRL